MPDTHTPVKGYRICDAVLFFPDMNLLLDPQKRTKLKLLSSASACLKILIQNQGLTITKECLMERVWGGKGVVVCDNTFYQTMLNIRKGLREMGIDKKIILTQYRKGVFIDKSILISAITDNEMDYADLGISPPPPEKAYPKLPETAATFKKVYVFFMFVFLLLACYFLFPTAFFSFGDDNDFFSQFIKTDYKVSTCDIYADKKSLDLDIINRFVRERVTCVPDLPDIYISSHPPLGRVSVFYCNSSFINGYKCISELFFAKPQQIFEKK